MQEREGFLSHFEHHFYALPGLYKKLPLQGPVFGERMYPHSNCLSADHLNRVWQHRDKFETMQRENPRLLSALAAWLDGGGFLQLGGEDDALPPPAKVRPPAGGRTSEDDASEDPEPTSPTPSAPPGAPTP